MTVLAHPRAVWGSRSDAAVAVTVPGEPGVLELLAVRRVAAGRYEVCCLPFLLYEICLGDVVDVDEATREITATVTDAGRFLFRVHTFRSRGGLKARDVASQVSSLGFAFEIHGRDLVAVDADASRGQELADFLEAGEVRGDWEYETGR